MIKIVSDTTCSLPKDIGDKYAITFIPVYLMFDGEPLRDQIDISSAEFYKRLIETDDLPQTMQPSVKDFQALYSGLLERNPGCTIISIHVSKRLSGTVVSAEQAAASFKDADIRVIDTNSLGLGHGLMVQQAAQAAQQTNDPEKVMQALAATRSTLKGYLVLDTLDYLRKSGRIGHAARLMGTLLNIKPILMLANGSVEPFARHRNRADALKALAALVIEGTKDQAGCHIGVMHTACEPEAQALAGMLRESSEPETLIVSELSGSVGVSLGPGALGVSWCSVPA